MLHARHGLHPALANPGSATVFHSYSYCTGRMLDAIPVTQLTTQNQSAAKKLSSILQQI